MTLVNISRDSFTVASKVFFPSAISFMSDSSTAVIFGLTTSQLTNASTTAMAVEVGTGVLPVTYLRLYSLLMIS